MLFHGNFPVGAARALSVLFLSVLVAACSGSGSDGSSQAQRSPTTGRTRSGEFTALTYNVAGLPQGISGSDPAENTPLIAPLLDDFDLVLLQESWKTPDPNPVAPLRVYHEILEEASSHPYKSEAAPQPLGKNPDRPTALLSDGLNRFSRFPFDRLVRVPWNGCFGDARVGAADCLAFKGFSVALTRIAEGVEVDVYNLHAEAGSEPQDQQLQAEDFRQLAEYMIRHSKGRPVIMGGDTNLHVDRPEDKAIWDEFLDATGLKDVCDVLDCGEDRFVIDKFAFRSAGRVTIEPLEHEFLRERFRRSDGEPLSDHDPLMVRWRWAVRD
ncbi:MAG: hypothetical protein KatS3mg008_1766 [Acidimicrobiales bacterium]|nr:MAG: hypothetical protein KatS3mg008_1766 [Acidimicrobiales bacterium]